MRGLVNLAKSLRNLACRRVNLTTSSSKEFQFRYHSVDSVYG